MRRLVVPAAACAMLAAAPSAVRAQEPPAAPVAAPRATPLLVIDPERLFRDSAFGRASAARVAAAQEALVAENRALEAQLQNEERDLTVRRSTLPAAEFRTLAAAFDQRAEGVRAAQAAKDRAILDQRQADQQRFLQAVAPALAQVMVEMGAVAILDKQVVFLSFDAIDVTDRAIAQVDAALGDGGTPPAATQPAAPPPAAPQPAAPPAAAP